MKFLCNKEKYHDNTRTEEPWLGLSHKLNQGAALVDHHPLLIVARLRSVGFGLWWFGDLPDREFRDGLMYGAGVSRAIFGTSSIMVSFFGSSPVIESMERPAPLAVGLSHSSRAGRSLSGAWPRASVNRHPICRCISAEA